MNSATKHPLPNDSAQVFFTDPPYYDAIGYAALSDFFYVWLKRTLGNCYPDLFNDLLSPKEEECIVNEKDDKDKLYFENCMQKVMVESRRVLAPNGIGIVVFAHKSTSGWEAQLQAMLEAGWIFTASWPIDTERPGRLRSLASAALSSSIHLVCRPRENPDGSLRTDEIGDWRDVLAELPKRIHEWMPRLAKEGVVGSDAIFACLGTALEIFSKYSRVEKASGEVVTLKEYLEHVWAAVAKEALHSILHNGDVMGFEQDARLTVIWFWALRTDNNGVRDKNERLESEYENSKPMDEEEKEIKSNKIKSSKGYPMEYDMARKLAQGLGIDIGHLSRKGGILEIKGNIVTLYKVGERAHVLLGLQGNLFGEMTSDESSVKYETHHKARMRAIQERRKGLLFKQEERPVGRDNAFLPGFAPPRDLRSPLQVLLDNGQTILDRLHQAMLLFKQGNAGLIRLLLPKLSDLFI